MDSISKEESLSRRSFLQGALIAGVGMTSASVLTACSPSATDNGTTGNSADAGSSSEGNYGDYPWPANPPEIADADVESEVEADIIIVGLGLAGVAATRSAVEEGASIITFEKSASPNCRSGDFAVMGGKTMSDWGLAGVVSPDTVADHELDECSYFPKRSIFLKWAQHSGEIYDWYIAAKPDIFVAESAISDIPDGTEAYISPYFIPLPEGYDYTKETHPCYPTSIKMSPDQSPVFLASWEKANSEGDVTSFFGHFVEKLIQDGDRVVGCYARNAETGKYIKATTNKALILATGEYASNDEFVDFFCPAVHENGVINWWPDMDVEGNPVNQGDGLKLGNWVGAAVQQHHAPMIHWMGKILGGVGMDMSPIGTAPFLYLNKDGVRYMNEDVPGQQMENQIELQPDRLTYQIWDANWGEQWKSFPIKHGKATYYMDVIPKNRGGDTASPDDVITPNTVEAAVEIGRVFKADSIGELLDKLEGINKENAIKSIERYNQLAKAGKDEDFGKTASRLFPVEVAPFYGTICGLGDMLVCIGGLESDEGCHVYSEDRSVIPGLYVAGNIQGNRFAVQYPIALKGVSHSMALYYGYVAGKNAVAGV
jgi:succinate dehydrogenase/fumarate reductase flavoprotein subunit